MIRDNGLDPALMTTDARLAELGWIVAAGVLRLRAQSSPLSAASGDSSLAIPMPRSVSRPGPNSQRMARKGGR